MLRQAGALFADQEEAPSTILFPTVYQGPQQANRKRPCSPDSTLRDVWERVLKPWLIAEGTATSTIGGYQMDLSRWEEVTSARDFGNGSFGERGPRVCDITRELLAEVRERLKQRCLTDGGSINTANRMIRSINTILHRASPAMPGNPCGEGLADEWLHMKPWPKTSSRKRLATASEINRWYERTEAARWPKHSRVAAPLWWKTIIVLMSTYGFRTRDALDLDWINVYWEPPCPNTDVSLRCPFGWLVLTPRKTQRKKPDPLVLPMTRLVNAHLRACWEASNRITSGRVLHCPIVFKSKRSRPDGNACHRTVQDNIHDERRWQQQRAGIVDPYLFQDIRKSCATWLGKVDRDLRRLVLGHAARDVSDEYYYQGIATIVEKLPQVIFPNAFESILSANGERQRTLFDDEG